MKSRQNSTAEDFAQKKRHLKNIRCRKKEWGSRISRAIVSGC